MIRFFRHLQHNNTQRISADETLTKIGELERNNLHILTRGALSTENACLQGGDFGNIGGWTFELEAKGFWIQKKDAYEVYAISQQDAIPLTVAVPSPADRYDLVEGRYKTYDDEYKSIDVIDQDTGIITQENHYIGKKIKLDAHVVTGVSGAGVSPALTAGTEATYQGTVIIPNVAGIDLSTDYNIKIDIDKTGNFVTIDCRGITPAATTPAEIIALINAAGFGTIASLVVAGAGTSYIKITSLVQGEDSYVEFQPPATLDATEDIFGLSEDPNYAYEYQGTTAYFKLGEILVRAGSANLIASDLRDIDDRSAWTLDGTTITRIVDLRTLFLNFAGGDSLTGQTFIAGLVDKDCVYWNTGTNQWELASFTNLPRAVVTNATTFEVSFNGEKTGLAGMTPGPIYMDSVGKFTSTKTHVKIGYANTASVLVIDIDTSDEANEIIRSGVFENGIINPDGAFAQRGDNETAIFTAATTPKNNDDTYLIDRWNLLSDGNDIVDVSQSTDAPAGSNFSMKFLVATINKKFGIVQILENKNSVQFLNKRVSISFQAKTTGGAVINNIRAMVLSWDGATADTVTSDVVNAWNISGNNPSVVANWTEENVAVNLALTVNWTKYTINNILVDTAGMKNLALFIWVDDTDCAANDELYISQIKLNQGTIATDYQPRQFQQEFALCKRYFEKSYHLTHKPTTATYNGVAGCKLDGIATGAFADISLYVKFSVEKRLVSPTVYIYDPAAGLINYCQIVGAVPPTCLSVTTYKGATGFIGGGNIGGLTSIHKTVFFHWTAEAEL